MTLETIQIKNFAGLEEIEIEVKKINILIGPQASGKSVIAKLLFYFKNFIHEIATQGLKRGGKRDLDRELSNKFKEYFPGDSWGKGDFLIRYSLGDEEIEIKTSEKRKTDISIIYSDFYRKSFDKVKRMSKRTLARLDEQESENLLFSRLDFVFEIQSSFLSDVSRQFGQEASFSQLFIPAGRSFFANLENSIFGFLSENGTVDPFLVEFGDYYEFVKERINRLKGEGLNSKKLLNSIHNLKERILYGQYLKIDGKDCLQMQDGRHVKLINCSSGQQEALPLTLILESLTFFGRGIAGQSIYIEEPEAHLFPTAQRDVVNLIATVYNARRDRLQFFITTHSPYILTAFNNLLQAGIFAKKGDPSKLEKLKKIVPESQFLHPDDVAAYSLNHEGCSSILSAETGLIDADIIDAVSRDLAVQFDDLLDLE